jgi:hypothetical protein
VPQPGEKLLQLRQGERSRGPAVCGRAMARLCKAEVCFFLPSPAPPTPQVGHLKIK